MYKPNTYDRPSNVRSQFLRIWPGIDHRSAIADLWYRRTKDLVPLFDLKVHLFENSLIKILAQLICLRGGKGVQTLLFVLF